MIYNVYRFERKNSEEVKNKEMIGRENGNEPWI